MSLGWVAVILGAGTIHSPEIPPQSQPFKQEPALSFQSHHDFCRSRDQAWPAMGVYKPWCHACAELLKLASTTSDPLSEPTCWCKGWQCPHNMEESLCNIGSGRQVNMRASVRDLWWVLGSVTIRSHGEEPRNKPMLTQLVSLQQSRQEHTVGKRQSL